MTGSTPIDINVGRVTSIVTIRMVGRARTPIIISAISFATPRSVINACAIGVAKSAPILAPNSISGATILSIGSSRTVTTNKSTAFCITMGPFATTSKSALAVSMGNTEGDVSLSGSIAFTSNDVGPLGFSCGATRSSKALCDQFVGAKCVIITKGMCGGDSCASTRVVRGNTGSSFNTTAGGVCFMSNTTRVASVDADDNGDAGVMVVKRSTSGGPVFGGSTCICLAPVMKGASQLILRGITISTSISAGDCVFAMGRGCSSGKSFNRFILRNYSVAAGPSGALCDVDTTECLSEFIVRGYGIGVRSKSTGHAVLAAGTGMGSFASLVIEGGIFCYPSNVTASFGVLTYDAKTAGTTAAIIGVIISGGAFIGVTPATSTVLITGRIDGISVRGGLLCISGRIAGKKDCL